MTLFVLHFNGFSSNDFWIQAAVGDYIRSHGELPKTALFTFTTANQFPFLAHEWGASVIMSFLAQFAGDYGLGYALIKFLISGVVFGFLYGLCRLRNCSKNVSLIVSAVTSVFVSFRLTLRAENLAFMLFLAFFYVFLLFIKKNSKQYLALLFLITLLWVNIHGSFILAFALCGLFLVSVFIHQIPSRNFSMNDYRGGLLAFLIIMAAALLNPFGIIIFISSLTMTSSPFLKQMVTEWQPTFSSGFAGTPSFYFYIFFIVLTTILVLKSIKKLQVFDKLIFFAFLILSTLALRHIAYLYLVATLYLGLGISDLSRKFRSVVLGFLISLLFLNCVFVINFGNYNQFDIGLNFDAPLDLSTIQWLRKENYHGHVFNSYTLGDQLVYNFYSNIEVVVDSRTDLYGEDYMKKFMNTIYDNKTFSNFIENNDVRLIIISNEDFNNYFFPNKGRLAYLDKNNWKLAFKSSQNFIFKKTVN